MQPAVRLPDKARSLPPTACGQLHFEHVAFRYEADPKPVLKDITIALPAGKKIALAGVSGVGKSTLIDLLQRHYDPSGGRILLDGVNLRQLDLAELRRRIVVVGQDTTLFAGSLLDNLRYAAPAASDEQIRQVARRAQVDEFARQLPQGYAAISALAAAPVNWAAAAHCYRRALLLDPLVLILDEATSAVDTQTEAEIIKAVDQLFADRTRLLISHRSETLQGADVVLELIGGYLIRRIARHNAG
ncbi:MAG: ATP-binding cassette domain-containing protein [Gammaproteobacteria bacterium]